LQAINKMQGVSLVQQHIGNINVYLMSPVLTLPHREKGGGGKAPYIINLSTK